MKNKVVKKPIIGIVAKNMEVTDADGKWLKQITCSNLRCALICHGANVIALLPPKYTREFSEDDTGSIKNNLSVEEQFDLIEQIKLCDGIVLQGGMNSDYYEEFVAKYCFDHNIPTFGICAGFNNMVRGLGGTTVNDIDRSVHARPDLKYAHDVIVEKDSILYSIVKTTNLKVNSIHSWVPKTLNNLVASAYSADGYIEGVEAPNKKFFVGVKFHPELLFETDKYQNAIIKAFVEACK